MEKYEYGRTTYAYHSSYSRNSKAVGVLWAVFTICFAIINILVFIQPYWLGSTSSSPTSGIIGLYQYCLSSEAEASVNVENCKGALDSFDNILNVYFKSATILVGVSALLIILCIAFMLLFFFLNSRSVFCICSWLQFFSFLCMLSGCIVFAAGWDDPTVKRVCGHTADQFVRGSCELRWAYILAIIGIFDILFLWILGFILATRQVKMLPQADTRSQMGLNTNGTYARGAAVTPMDMDAYSTRAPSHRSKAQYASSQNFQL